MNTQRYSKKRNVCLDLLAAEIEEARSTDTGRIPSIKFLAKKAGVSPVTMWKAASGLCKAGRLVSIPRGGFLVKECLEPSIQTATDYEQPVEDRTVRSLPRWRRIQAEIQGDIESERLVLQSNLPMQKQLAAMYRTSPAIIRRVLDSLEQCGIIKRAVRGYSIKVDTPSTPTAEIVVIGSTNLLSDLYQMSPRTGECWRTLNLLRHHRNVAIRVVSLTEVFNAFSAKKGSLYTSLVANPAVLGCIVLTLGFHSGEIRELIGYLGQTGKPFSLIEELGKPASEKTDRCPMARTFLMGCGEVSGKLLGEHLARMGHRRVCWVAPAHGEADYWVGQRLEGLRAGLSAGSRRISLTTHCVAGYSELSQIRTAMKNDPIFGKLLLQLKAIADQIPPECPGPDELFRDRAARQYLEFRFIRREIETLFKELVSQCPDATAWVLSNESVAVMAQDFCNRNAVRVPQTVALAGFDDGEMSQTRELTSYNFNTAAVVQAAFNHIINPQVQSSGSSPVIEIPGFVSVRESTARKIR